MVCPPMQSACPGLPAAYNVHTADALQAPPTTCSCVSAMPSRRWGMWFLLACCSTRPCTGRTTHGLQPSMETPLLTATADGHPDVIRALLSAGAKVDARNNVSTDIRMWLVLRTFSLIRLLLLTTHLKWLTLQARGRR